MKYIIAALLSILMIAMVACGNDGGISPVKLKNKTDYRDFNIYYGSEKGASQKLIDTIKVVERKDKDGIVAKETIYLDVDSLYATYVSTHYFAAKAAEVRASNSITFEFLDNNLLTYTSRISSTGSAGTQIIASYTYKDDSLFVMKNETEPVFVARKEKNGDSYFRTVTLLRTIINEGGEQEDKTQLIEKEVLNLDRATELAGFDSPSQMINKEDSVIWCNVKFIYR